MRQSSTASRLRATVGIALLVLAGGCVLTPAGIKFLELAYKLSAAQAQGERKLVHVQGYPEKVTLKKQFVRLSGRLSGTATLPQRIDVEVVSETEDGKVYDSFELGLEIAADGGFSASRKWKKNIQPGTTQSIYLTPIGAALPKGLEVALCIEVGRKKILGKAVDCAPGSFALVVAPDLESPGYHEFYSLKGRFPRGLGATKGRKLVVALRDVSRPDQMCPEEVPWDGCASVDWDDVAGVRNAPAGGGYFENTITVETESGELVLFLNRFLGLARELEDDFALG